MAIVLRDYQIALAEYVERMPRFAVGNFNCRCVPMFISNDVDCEMREVVEPPAPLLLTWNGKRGDSWLEQYHAVDRALRTPPMWPPYFDAAKFRDTPREQLLEEFGGTWAVPAPAEEMTAIRWPSYADLAAVASIASGVPLHMFHVVQDETFYSASTEADLRQWELYFSRKDKP